MGSDGEQALERELGLSVTLGSVLRLHPVLMIFAA
jgi:hypothetical protein